MSVATAALVQAEREHCLTDLTRRDYALTGHDAANTPDTAAPSPPASAGRFEN
nr:hypothetical protein GCM10025730_40720 [Promicromonospora thailandica]